MHPRQLLQQTLTADWNRRAWRMEVVVQAGSEVKSAGVTVTCEWANGWFWEPKAQEAVEDVRKRLIEYAATDGKMGKDVRTSRTVKELVELGRMH